MQIRHDQIELSGGPLCYVHGGQGSPIVLIHGGYGSWAHWAANVGPLAAERRVYAVDLPGFGASYDPGRCLAPEEQAEVMADFLDRLDLQGVTVAGFSFGSLVAVNLAHLRPDRVDALVLVNPPGVGPRSEAALALPGRMSALSKEQGLRAGVQGTLRELMLCNHALIDQALIDNASQSIQRTRYVTRSLSQQSQMLPLLQRVNHKRVKVLIGAQDPFHSNDLQGRRASIDSVLGGGATQIVAQAAHWLQYDRAEDFNRLVVEFTQRAAV